ncbi:microtubule-binding calmodulin-regulated spectrin-associated-domain-containing protein [Chytridium lagenaria]|nr:microtubule-binding calmodulin-regulated spectrin-associated-domain-containing protein [Chytridium lagenaria]
MTSRETNAVMARKEPISTHVQRSSVETEPKNVREPPHAVGKTSEHAQLPNNLVKLERHITASTKPVPEHHAPTNSQKKKKIGLGPDSQSNRKIIKNALIHVCLAGTVNEKVKHDVLEDLSRSPANHFIILFRGAKNHAFRGLYAFDNRETVSRVYAPRPVTPHGSKSGMDFYPDIDFANNTSGPEIIGQDDVLEFYKYDCGQGVLSFYRRSISAGMSTPLL